MSVLTIVLLSLAALGAGTVDAIAGGGGLITVPALLAAGLDPLRALATNKGQSMWGSGAALVAFWWSHVPRERLAAFLDRLGLALQPGALVVFIDNTFVPGNSTPLSRTDDDGNTYQLRFLNDGRSFEVLKNYPTDEELRSAVEGWLEGIELRRLTYYWWLIGRVEEVTDSKPVQGCP